MSYFRRASWGKHEKRKSSTNVNPARLSDSCTSPLPSPMRMSFEDVMAAGLHPDVPDSFKSCILYLHRPEVLKEIGLFRVSGNATDVQRYSQALDGGGLLDLTSCADVPTICGLLKQRMRLESLPLNSNESKMIDMAICTGLDCGMNMQQVVQAAQDIIKRLASTSFHTLKALVRLLGAVDACQGNRMTFGTLATSVGIQIFPGVPAKNSEKMLQILYEHMDIVFPSSGSEARNSLQLPPGSPGLSASSTLAPTPEEPRRSSSGQATIRNF
eukprot:m.1248046 g.1248046  ORF g.1248046 m.1248046 type:complete len:271 (+) comp24696_c0_seq1:223-1035(+)